METNTIVIWLAPKNMSYEKVPVNTKQGTSYKCISYKNMHCFTELQNYHLRYVSFLYILIPKQNQGCCSPVSSACLHCTRGQKLQWYPAPVLASLLHPPAPTSHTHTHTHTAVLLQIKAMANKTKHPFSMNGNGWQTRKSSYSMASCSTWTVHARLLFLVQRFNAQFSSL